MTDLIVFDVDKTLVKGNLHEIIIKYWVGENKSRVLSYSIFSYFVKLLPHSMLRRKFEYFPINLISEEDFKKLTINVIDQSMLINAEVLRRINRYKNKGVAIALVTAAPTKVVRHLSLHFEIPVYASKSFLGVIYNDLLAKKSKVYGKLTAQGYIIRSIYSDSHLDFKIGSKNFLISDAFKIEKPL